MFPSAPTRTRRSGAPHLARLVVWLVLWAVAAAPAAHAAETNPPVEVVKQLYAAHALAFDGKGPDVHTGEAASLAYLHPALAAQLRAKELGFDPFYDGQDAEITELAIVPHPETPVLRGTAMVVAGFKNFDTPVKLTFLLRRVPGAGWRVIDVDSGEWRLTKLLAEN